MKVPAVKLPTVKKSVPAKKKVESAPAIASVVMVYMKSSGHWYGLVQPHIETVEGIKFLIGKQVTGKDGHRMEGKRTMIPFENVASIIEFATEEDLWNEPQPRNIPEPDLGQKSVALTSHEQNQGQHNNANRKHQGGGHSGGHGRGGRNNRNNNRSDEARFQNQYDYNRERYNGR